MAAKQVSWSSTRVEDEQFIVSIFPLPMINGAVYLMAQSASFRVQGVWHGKFSSHCRIVKQQSSSFELVMGFLLDGCLTWGRILRMRAFSVESKEGDDIE
jgi:hypothetical protein